MSRLRLTKAANFSFEFLDPVLSLGALPQLSEKLFGTAESQVLHRHHFEQVAASAKCLSPRFERF